jgi:hypothetical protein
MRKKRLTNKIATLSNKTAYIRATNVCHSRGYTITEENTCTTQYKKGQDKTKKRKRKSIHDNKINNQSD